MRPIQALMMTSVFTVLNSISLFAQDRQQSCTVNSKKLAGSYIGDCKKGLANGKGEAAGIDRYVGLFKNGSPNGKGTYYYSDTVFHTGNFQDGLREGKGEAYYKFRDKPDSIVKGYWSGDVYRGKSYITYSFNRLALFDLIDISPSKETGNKVTIEISTTTGSPSGNAPKAITSPGYLISITELISADEILIRKISSFKSDYKFIETYEIDKFPVKLFGTLSNDQTFELELYKPAIWMVKFYKNI